MPEGLSSSQAQERLLQDLSTLISRNSTTHWGQEIRKNPFTTLCNVAVGVAGLLLVLHFVVAASNRNGVILFHGLFLIFVAAFNVALFGWEVYILKTQKIRHLLVRLKPVFETACPWTTSDYPKAPISTLRGHLTVPAYRDGALVNVPISLLVRGDVMELDSGMPCPANATLLKSGGFSSDSKSGLGRVSADEVLPEDMFKEKEQGGAGSGETIRFLPEAKPVRLVVDDAPILTLLESSVKKVGASNFLAKETGCRFCVVHVVILVAVYFTSLTVNLVRYFALRDDFEDSWPQLMFGNPVYTCVPILFLQFPLVWSFTNLYGTARISQLVEHGPLHFKTTGLMRIRVFFETLAAMAKLVFRFSHYPDYRVFHVLGTLTSVCAVDKEYLLTSGFPSPERVFFMRTEEVPAAKEREGSEKVSRASEEQGSEAVIEELGSEKACEKKGKTSEQLGGSEKTIEHEEKETVSEESKLASCKTSPLSMSCPRIKVYEPSPNTSTASGKYQRSQSIDGGKVQQCSVPVDTLSPLSPCHHLVPLPSPIIDTCSTTSVLEDSAPFEVVTEIFNLSPDPTSYSGIAFDEIEWYQHINSLKPIGVNLLATSHLSKTPFYLSPSGRCNELKLHLHKSSCSCSLSAEIGVAEFYSNNFTREALVHTISDHIMDFQRATRRRSTATTFVTHNNSVIHPHIVSSVVKEYDSNKLLVMSRGSGDLVASCCTDFWDGKDLQPMTSLERESIVDYYNCRSLSSYCVALAYSPLPDVDLTKLPRNEIGIYIPPGHLESSHANFSTAVAPWKRKKSLAESLFNSLQCNQVFLGLVCLQFRPKQDVMLLIEDLYASGIRFVHFTAENELRAKIFAQKLGLEADWNCFISLAQPSEEEDSSLTDDDSDSSSHNNSSLSSSVMSVFQSTMSHIRARLPKGIKNIRPHIDKVDNVPLLVSLFTDCTAETITEMIKVMQENSEVVLCIGNAWNHKNINIFSQADISLSLIPQCVDLPKCTITETCALSTSNSSQNASSILLQKTWPSPLELASYLNSASCQLCFGRDNEVSLLSLITESRRIISSIRLGLLFMLGCSLTLSLLLLLSTFLFLPPPLNGGHLLWLLIFTIPLIMISFLSTSLDKKIRTLMPNKQKDLFSNKCLIGTELVVLFGSTALVLLMLFGLTLGEICLNDIFNATCHPLLGDRREDSRSPWNGWGVGGQAEQGLLLAQDLTAFFASLYLVVLSVRYIHRTQPLWRLWRYTSWQYLVVAVGTVLLQVLYSVLSQVSAQRSAEIVAIAGLDSVPLVVWCVGLLWPPVVLVLLELLKYVDKKKLFEAQTLLRLQFGTKLGMHSPV